MIDGMVMKVGELSSVNSDRSDSQNLILCLFFFVGGGLVKAVSGLFQPSMEGTSMVFW